MEGESGATRSMTDDLHSLDIQGDEIEDENGVTRTIIDEIHFRMSKQIKWKVKVVLLEVSLINLMLGIPKETKWKVK